MSPKNLPNDFLHDETMSSNATYEACLSITAGPNVQLTSDASFVSRAPEIIFNPRVSISVGTTGVFPKL